MPDEDETFSGTLGLDLSSLITSRAHTTFQWKLHYGINFRLARQYKCFLHHVLSINQRLTNLPCNRALNNVLRSSD